MIKNSKFMIFTLLILTLIFLTIAKITTAFAPLNYDPPTQIKLNMFALQRGGVSTGSPCVVGDIRYGCTYFEEGTPKESILPYPFDSSFPTLNIESQTVNNTEQGYLYNVVTQELGPSMPPASVRAQAIAARTYAYSLIEDGSQMNNSTQFQAYIPYKYAVLSDNEKLVINQAVAGSVYLSLPNDTNPIHAFFGADNGIHTTKGAAPYLVSVYDPINAKEGTFAGTGYGGMGQRGAARWGFGNENWYGNGNDWSVKWETAQQILSHYYTGIEFQGITNPKVPQLPEPGYRFNMLNFTGLDSEQTIQFKNGTDFRNDFGAVLQNSGTLAWNLGDIDDVNECGTAKHNIALSYHLYDETNTNLLYFEEIRTALCSNEGRDLLMGEDITLKNINVKLPFDDGLPRPNSVTCYTLRWDIELAQGHAKNIWISRPDTPKYEWPTQDIEICYNPNTANDDKPDPPKKHSSSTPEGDTKLEQISIVWQYPNTPIKGYRYKYEGPAAKLEPHEPINGDPTLHYLNLLPEVDGEYTVYVKAYNENGESDPISY